MKLGHKINYVIDRERNIRYIGPRSACLKLIGGYQKQRVLGYHLAYPLLDLEEEKRLLNKLKGKELWKWPVNITEEEFDKILDGVIV